MTKNKYEPLTTNQKDFIFENFHSLGPRKLTELLKITYYQVRRFARENKLKVTKGALRKILLERSTKRDYCKKLGNLEKFLNITDRETAYLLGFLWADGYIHKNKTEVSIGMVADDANYIERIVLNHGKFKIYNYQQRGRRPKTCFKLSDRRINAFLSENDFTAKSWVSADKIHIKDTRELTTLFLSWSNRWGWLFPH